MYILISVVIKFAIFTGIFCDILRGHFAFWKPELILRRDLFYFTISHDYFDTVETVIISFARNSKVFDSQGAKILYSQIAVIKSFLSKLTGTLKYLLCKKVNGLKPT